MNSSAEQSNYVLFKLLSVQTNVMLLSNFIDDRMT